MKIKIPVKKIVEFISDFGMPEKTAFEMAISHDFRDCEAQKKHLKNMNIHLRLQYLKRCNYEIMISGAKKPYRADQLSEASAMAKKFLDDTEKIGAQIGHFKDQSSSKAKNDPIR